MPCLTSDTVCMCVCVCVASPNIFLCVDLLVATNLWVVRGDAGMTW